MASSSTASRSPASSQGPPRGHQRSGLSAQSSHNVPQGQGQNQGQGQGQGQVPTTSLQQDMAFWLARVKEWYPKLQERTYFLPPVYMNTTGEQAVQIFGTEVFIKRLPADNVPKGVPDVLFNSTVKEDKSQQKVLKALHEVSKDGKEVMFVLSQLNFKDYLPSHSSSATPRLPTPRDLKSQNKDQGDFDVLVLHKHLGVLVGEIKSVGDNFQELGFSEQKQEQEIKKKVKQALKQLDKALDVLTHLTKDQQPLPRILKTLILPSISQEQLQQVLNNDPPLKDDVCKCLDLPITSDPVPYCLTSDDVTEPDNWWKQRMAANGLDPAMNDSVYLDLVSRFCGPATTVSVFCSSEPRLGHRPDVRTEGEGVSETGHRFTRFMVTPTQLTVLHVSPPFVFLVGPPGVGKTFVLILKALDWVGKGEHVLVLSTAEKSEASSCMIYQQLEQTVVDPAAKSRIHLEYVELESDQNEGQDAAHDAVTSIVKNAQQGYLNIIVDEAPWK
ncbi:hypothetical protein V1264_021855 [Littorina saxatilis]|uniref:Uncharacterized protein n=2 Tax=Littorina saxatilis TaxID=31220 RepID=A0AAN9FWJ4_9CAEN